MRPEEMARLQGEGKVRPAWDFAVLVALVAGGGVWVVSRLALGYLPKETADRATIVLLAVTMAGTFVYYLANEIRAAKRSAEHSRRRYAADLAAQQVEEWRVRVVDAIEVEEFEDEGRHAYLELKDGRVLFLSGQYLYDNDEDDTTPRFPNDELLITRLPHAGDILDLERLGDYLSPSATLPPFVEDDHLNDRVPGDGQILPGPLSRYATREK
jgi:hypothetical protein